jgi:hypothetical protein
MNLTKLSKQRKDESSVSVNTNNNSVFEKNTFQEFAKDKIQTVFKAESEIDEMIADLNKALKKKIKMK